MCKSQVSRSQCAENLATSTPVSTFKWVKAVLHNFTFHLLYIAAASSQIPSLTANGVSPGMPACLDQGLATIITMGSNSYYLPISPPKKNTLGGKKPFCNLKWINTTSNFSFSFVFVAFMGCINQRLTTFTEVRGWQRLEAMGIFSNSFSCCEFAKKANVHVIWMQWYIYKTSCDWHWHQGQCCNIWWSWLQNMTFTTA